MTIVTSASFCQVSRATSQAELAALATQKAAAEAEKVRKALQSLGDVNLGAIEEHEELKEIKRGGVLTVGFAYEWKKGALEWE